MTNRDKAISYAKQQRSNDLDKLISFSSIPSISTDPTKEKDILAAANWVANELNYLGFDKINIIPTQGHPIVYGEYMRSECKGPTVLIYGHYDVQPAEPLEEWISDPFIPVVRGDCVFARGVSDMKGQIAAALNAIEATYKNGYCPINVKFLVEGEEEIGSPHLPSFFGENYHLLNCDFALNLDTGMISPDLPTITYALRGLAYFEIHIKGPRHDLHSGVFGGTVHNPAQALAELIAGMHDKNGTITLPGFYDEVQPLSREERLELSRLPKNESWYLENTGVPALWGESEFSADERVGARPTLEINGLYSGFIGEGGKTVLPASAMAKISCRLVPDQDPTEVYHQLVDYCKRNAPKTIQWEIKQIAGSPPSISNRKSPWIQAFVNAAEAVWNVPPVFKREGGSVPVVSLFQNILGVDTLNTGFGLPTDNMHGPNEHLHLPTWYKGIDALIHFFFNLENL